MTRLELVYSRKHHWGTPTEDTRKQPVGTVHPHDACAWLWMKQITNRSTMCWAVRCQSKATCTTCPDESIWSMCLLTLYIVHHPSPPMLTISPPSIPTVAFYNYNTPIVRDDGNHSTWDPACAAFWWPSSYAQYWHRKSSQLRVSGGVPRLLFSCHKQGAPHGPQRYIQETM